MSKIVMSDEKGDEAAADSSEPVLDATGLYCPEPVMLLHNRIRDMDPGDILQLRATDPSTTRDVPKFCLYLGHELMDSRRERDLYLYRIRKKQE